MNRLAFWLSLAVLSAASIDGTGCDGTGGSDRALPTSTGNPASGSSQPAVSGGAGKVAAPVTSGLATAQPSDAGTPSAAPKVWNDGNDPALNNATAGHVCARLAQIQCAGEAYCCDSPGRDQATCEATMRDGCINKLYLDAISENPVSGFDAAQAEVAFAKFEQEAKTCNPMIASVGVAADGLLSMMRGTIAAGESCGPPLSLDKASAAAQLASCLDGANTACLPDAALDWTCAPKGAAGASCFSDLNCLPGMYCPNPNAEFGVATCSARKPAGQACTLPNECASLACKGGKCAELSVQSAYCLAN